MTYAYAVTRQGMAEQIEDELRQQDAEAEAAGQKPHLGGAGNREASRWLTDQLRRVIEEEVPAARRAMDWLKSAVKPLNKADLAVEWVTPLGLPVLHSYKKFAGKSVELRYMGRTMKLYLQEDQEKEPGQDGRMIDGRRSTSSIAPNFIHSLDAAHLMMVANACTDDGISDLAVIHDSFGTHAANTDRLAVILRETFVDLYRWDPLARFREAIIAQVPKRAKVPELPDYGEFDLNQVLDSTYMFA
jgi:DNA-directed RNA polymerase